MSSFARTKIQPPRARRGSLLDRPALRARLVDALGSASLVLLKAPAGFGKTTALVQALDALPSTTAVAWISCDESDLPIQLFECLVTALDGCDLPWRVSPESLVARAAADSAPAPQSRALQAMVAELVNALDASEVPHGVIAVDDLHRVVHAPVHEFLDRLLERLPSRWSVAVATREEPPISLARVRARGELVEFRATDLRFDLDVTAAVLRDAGIDPGQATALHVRTQGWPAGVRLALNVLRDDGQRTAAVPALVDREMFDFVAVEILDRLPPALRRFAVQCAILPELSAARCEALTGDPQAAQHLETIERDGLFVTRVGEGETVLRFHDLFRDALVRCLHREPAFDAAALLQRAADTEPDALRRIDYLLRARDFARAAAQVHARVPAMVTAGEITSVERLLDRFPGPVRDTEPALLLARAILHWGQWRWPGMVEAALAASGAFERAGRPLEALSALAYAAVGVQGGGLALPPALENGRVAREAAAEMAGRAADIAGGRRYDSNEAGITAAMLDALVRGWAAYHDGDFERLPDIVARQVDLLAATTGPDAVFRMMPLPGFIGLPGMAPPIARFVAVAAGRIDGAGEHLSTLLHGAEGAHRVWQGDLAGGRALLKEAASEVQWHDFPLRSTLYVFVGLIAADLLAGDRAALRADAEDLLAVFARAGPRPDLSVRVATEVFTVGRWLLAAGERDEALRVWSTLDALDARRERPLLAVQRSTLPAWRALAAGLDDEAEAGFTRALATHGARLELFGQASGLRLRLAHLRLRTGAGPRAAAQAIQPLFERHAADADIAAVWLAGGDLLSELARADWQGELPGHAQAVLHGWAVRAVEVAIEARAASGPEPAGRAARGGAAAGGGAAVPAAVAASAPLAGTAASAGSAPAAPVDAAGHAPGHGAGAPAAVLPFAAARVGPVALSERELEVLARLAAGDSNKLIARAFDLSPHTVKRHVANILDKLGLRSRGQASAWYHEHVRRSEAPRSMVR